MSTQNGQERVPTADELWRQHFLTEEADSWPADWQAEYALFLADQRRDQPVAELQDEKHERRVRYFARKEGGIFHLRPDQLRDVHASVSSKVERTEGRERRGLERKAGMVTSMLDAYHRQRRAREREARHEIGVARRQGRDPQVEYAGGRLRRITSRTPLEKRVGMQRLYTAHGGAL